MPDDNYKLALEVLVNAIRPALAAMDAGGLAVEQLVLGTGIQESLLIYRQQGGGGPALGLFQMEPATHDDCWANYLDYRAALANKVKSALKPGEDAVAATLRVNDVYAAAMCRVKYRRVSAALPGADDIEAMANYWKLHYNTPHGAGKPEEYLEKWPLYVNSDTFD